jgi:hypothetical protein
LKGVRNWTLTPSVLVVWFVFLMWTRGLKSFSSQLSNHHPQRCV